MDGDYVLADESSMTLWRLYRHRHELSADAMADRRSLDDIDEVPICWAVPLDRLNEPGKFWAYFPTNTASLVAGILNAPWKTNEDRQNLLPGPFNDELIRAAAGMITDSVPELATREKPVRHLDALPRRHEAQRHRARRPAPGQRFLTTSRQESRAGSGREAPAGTVCPLPPGGGGRGGTGPMGVLSKTPGRLDSSRALTPTRMSVINRLFDPVTAGGQRVAPRATVQQWLEALVDDIAAGQECKASGTAVETAALIPAYVRSQQPLGKIVLTAAGTWREADPEAVFLPDPSREDKQFFDAHRLVHPELACNRSALAALQKLGIRLLSVEVVFGESTGSGP